MTKGPKTVKVALPSGGPLNLSADVGRLFMMQIEMYSRGGVDSESLGQKINELLNELPDRQLSLANAIASSLVRITK
ncbi:hypothetical protein [Dongia rigui]|uniref:Uncharacterized protein n=1 Tax=Dongia rigui TaxID=940149 RepID=A0ABU5DZQ9_9PROT|nr:hypothetical protein [Dongia rigui]MDY0872817.1 hypothetical protein [Dongia rigui]